MKNQKDDVVAPAIHKLITTKSSEAIEEEEWKKVLDADEFHVMREAGTEEPFSGKFDKFFETGNYNCRGCGVELFVSEHKYNSGSGWPSFYKSVDDDKNIVRLIDTSMGRVRTEIRCRKCNSHLGHVFEDGPKDTTGLRYCVNSISMDFVGKEEQQY